MNNININNQASPITPIKIGNNNNPDEPGWTVKKSNSKINLSTSSYSEPPSSLTIQPTSKKSKKKIFASQNRYELLRQDENLPTNSSTLLTPYRTNRRCH